MLYLQGYAWYHTSNLKTLVQTSQQVMSYVDSAPQRALDAAKQNLKNVLIVPRGAKGAFILRHPPADMQARRAHADEMYKIFIGGLLDVTDNLIKVPADEEHHFWEELGERREATQREIRGRLKTAEEEIPSDKKEQ